MWSIASNISISDDLGNSNINNNIKYPLDDDWLYFSAVCCFYAKQIYQNYEIPLGLLDVTWGGTNIEAWSSPTILSKCNDTNSSGSPGPSTLWNAMIYPLLNITIKSVI